MTRLETPARSGGASQRASGATGRGYERGAAPGRGEARRGADPDETQPASTRGRPARPGLARAALLSALVFLLLALPVGGLAPLLMGTGWWFTTCLVVAVVLAVAAGARLLPVASWIPSLAALVAWGVSITVLFAPSEALFGILPTFDTLRTLRDELRDAGASIASQGVPAEPVASIVFLLALTIGLLALVADALVFAVRMPALVGLVPITVLAVPYTIRQQDFDVWLFVWLAAVFLVLVWLADRWGVGLRLRSASSLRPGRNTVRALVSGAVAIALAVVLPAVTPGLTANSFHSLPQGQLPSVYSSGVDPTIQLSQDLRRTNPVLSMTYTTSAASGLYLKLVNLSNFTNGPWQPENTDSAHPLGTAFDTPDGLNTDVATQEVTTSVSVSGLRSDWLPLPYPAETVTGLTGDWVQSPGSLTVTAVEANADGQNYTVTSLDVEPSAAQLAASSAAVPAALQSYVSLPRGIDPIIQSTATEVTAGAVSNYDKAVALQKYFTSGAFTYSVTAPVEGKYDGGNFQAVAKFLSAKSGYCIHFASAMAVMARSLGIPSRIAIGYHPGAAVSRQDNGTATFQVFSDELHAWPELWFEGVGWLSFEPTPGLGLTPPAYSLPNYTSATPATTAPSTAPSSATPVTPRTQTPTDLAANPALTPQAQAAETGRAWLVAVVIVIVVGGLALIPAGLRRLRRRRRLSRMAGSGRSTATIGWREITDTAVDYRLDVPAGETVRAFGARLAALDTVPPEPVLRLVQAVERERFAPGGAAEPDHAQRQALAGDVREVIRGLQKNASRADDRWALIVPRSLFSRAEE
ncbi:DUF3488 and transglutaminase-like domain-containing protein [Subtercola sp. RTI3]|uniref:transglutaminase TgpA family protein n=1 Tax=Subtercola sp. RTI3 TaxID=3048639 RepID=UPI002B22DDAC|nr:DUF3488 and transglutaminase-like domain-containing protein [Subtercola sp. RTI3]MEA9985564.1 DUF3488 and transglutaminase-like domain-containing protein [Subtercola sp. RTI3]